MKKTLTNLFIFVLLLAAPATLRAQDLAMASYGHQGGGEPQGSRLIEYQAAPNATYNAEFWRGLGQEINISPRTPLRKISEQDLQNVIFFASVHGNRVDLRPSVPSLMEVFRYSNNPQMRLMAVAGLAAIGDSYGMTELRDAVRWEQTTRVRKAALVALHNYDAQQQAAN